MVVISDSVEAQQLLGGMEMSFKLSLRSSQLKGEVRNDIHP